jgi:hypothetical protein
MATVWITEAGLEEGGDAVLRAWTTAGRGEPGGVLSGEDVGVTMGLSRKVAEA